MLKTVTTQAPATPATPAVAQDQREKPAIIASRRHCEAEGVGLSHYILMDRKASA